MTDKSNHAQALDIENRLAAMLMNMGRELVAIQFSTQADDVDLIRAALGGAYEWRVELNFGTNTYVRIVTTDVQGDDTHLLRRLEMELPQNTTQ